jgi:hypothetical protein
MVPRRDLTLSALSLEILASLGWWLGEDTMTLGLMLFLALLLSLAAFLILAVGLGRRLAGITGVGAAIVLVLAFWGGSNASARAFNECVAVGESVRERLAAYRAHNGRYPQKLSELPGHLPCRRPLRGSLLEYTPQGRDAYQLRFRDWLVTHEATDETEFLAIK